jgi:hypothetical protein
MITVVSGLPRSGTSMMMQVLQAGGLPVLCDEHRPADGNNLRGYFEYQKVKRLATDNTWLAEAEGKAVKVVSQLLYHLSPGYQYRVIFMRRDLREVLRSQEHMLASIDGAAQEPQPEMMEHFTRHLESLETWLRDQPHYRVLPCNYRDVVADPTRLARVLSNFLEIDLNPAGMKSAVDPALYHQRA